MEETEGYVDEVNIAYTPVKAIALSHDDDSKQWRGRKISRGHESKKTKEKRLELLLTRPPYTLTVGDVNVRKEHRARLNYLLDKLVLQHNWTDASGVLSALLKATCRDRTPPCPERTLRHDRKKYSVAMEICRHMESDPKAYSMKIEDLYRRWILKVRSLKNKPSNDRYILLDHILSSFARNEHIITHDALKSLKQTGEFGRDPMTYLVIGLASYEVWYSGLLEEIRQRNLEELSGPMLSETVGTSSSGLLDNMKGEDEDSIIETCSIVHYHSEASVANDNDALIDSNQNPIREASRSNVNIIAETHQQLQTEYISGNTIDTLDENDGIEHHNDQFDSSNDFNYHGFQSLLPFKMPLPENVAYYSSYKDYYNDAVNYLKLALQFPPPISEASLLPLVQLLVLGDQVNEAFLVLEPFCNESNSVIPHRLRARLQECVKTQDFDKLSSSFESVMKNDPTCRRPLTRLIEMHRRGEYGTGHLVEMISLHLEATDGDLMIWKEFANCLRKFSISDNVSMCIDGEEAETERRRTMCFSTIPAMFLEGMSGKTWNWKDRCELWLNGNGTGTGPGTGHFCRHVLASEIKKGVLELMVYKAACASHLYGNDLEYVVKVHACKNKYDNSLLTFLRTHMEESIGVFSNRLKKTKYGQMTIV